jgi:uncharacterized delta-60 repeat protein
VFAGERDPSHASADVLVGRLTPKGALDGSFSSNGWARVDVRGNGTVGAVAIQPDGSVVVVASAYTAKDSDVVVLRFTPHGHLDRSFSGNGIFTSSFPSAQATAEAVDVLSNGKILVAGGLEPTSGTNEFFVLRLRPNGRLDGTFSGDGRRSVDFGADAWANAVTTDGSAIVVAGSVDTGGGDIGFAAARLTTVGGLDPAFSGDGLASLDAVPTADDYANTAFVDGDGTYLLVGPGSPTDTYGLSFVRLTSAGLPDASFGGGDGALSSDPTVADDYLDSVARSGTKIVASGASVGSVTKIEVVRFTAAGALDATFGGGDGVVTTHIKPYSVSYAVAVQPGTKAIVAAGRRVASTDDVAMVKYRG